MAIGMSANASAYYALTPEQKKAKIAQATGSVPTAQPVTTPNTAPVTGVSAPTAGVTASPTPTGYKPPSVAPNLSQGQSGYFDKTYGGIDKYVGTQQGRYDTASAQGDTEMLGKLNADASRVGYAFKPYTAPEVVNTPALTGGTPPSNDAVTNVRTSSELQQQSGDGLAIERAALKNAIDTQMASLKNNSAYANQLTNDSRVLQDFQQSNSVNPFTQGKQTWDKGLIGRQRSIDDSSRNSELTTQMNSLSTEMANFDKLSPERQRGIFNELLQLERNFGLNQAQVTGEYGGQQTMAARNADRDFALNESGVTGQYKGVQTQQAQGQAYDQQNQDWNNRFNFGQATGTFANGQQTMQNQEFQYTQGRDKVADDRWQSEFDRIKEQDGIANALNWAQNSISQQNANTSASSSANSAANSKIDNLMNAFKATGVAPAGLESLGIKAGDKLPEGEGTVVKLDPKESVDNVQGAKAQIEGKSIQEALQYAMNTKEYYTDADYKALIVYINKNNY